MLLATVDQKNAEIICYECVFFVQQVEVFL